MRILNPSSVDRFQESDASHNEELIWKERYLLTSISRLISMEESLSDLNNILKFIGAIAKELICKNAELEKILNETTERLAKEGKCSCLLDELMQTEPEKIRDMYKEKTRMIQFIFLFYCIGVVVFFILLIVSEFEIV